MRTYSYFQFVLSAATRRLKLNVVGSCGAGVLDRAELTMLASFANVQTTSASMGVTGLTFQRMSCSSARITTSNSMTRLMSSTAVLRLPAPLRTTSQVFAPTRQAEPTGFSALFAQQHDASATAALPVDTGVTMVDSLNRAISNYPTVTGWIWLYHGPTFAGASYALLTAATMATGLGGLIPIELGPAFVIHGVTRRFRLPLVLAVAAGLSKLAPSLTTVPVTRMLAAPFVSIGHLKSPPQPVRAGSLTDRYRKGRDWLVAKGIALDKAVGGSDMVNKFGLAYVVAGRCVGTASLIAIAAGLRQGVDIQPWMDSIGTSIDGMLPAVTMPKLQWPFADSALASISPPPSTEAITHATASASSAAAAAAPTAAGSGIVSTATEMTARWAAGCLLVNFMYPLVVTHGVAGTANRVGRWMETSPTWKSFSATLHEHQAAAAAELRQQSNPAAAQATSGYR